jgi:pimeloyl-ACP methyl ester carboxylesterase
LWDAIAKQRNKALPCEWAKRVERLVLLATWDKGWSISDRIGWLYSIGLNALGLWGRLLEFGEIFGIEEGTPGRTMLDMRKGAPFVMQTRLLWMAYRRWNNSALRALYNTSHPLAYLDAPDSRETVNPPVIQIIGAQDNFVSPQDQVDNDVEAAVWEAGKDKDQKLYFLLEMEDSDHGGVIDFSGSLGRRRGFFGALVRESGTIYEEREKVFAKALTHLLPELEADSLNPTHFFDQQTQFDPMVQDVVFVMHGIRDDGYWTHRIAETIKEADVERRKTVGAAPATKPIVSCTPTYGYFPMGAFIMPWIRRQKVEWFMDMYVEVKARFPLATMHYVGHSNGTYLAASALDYYPAARFGNIYFAGSVVNPKFDWIEKVDKERVKKFHNARGGDDWVVAFLPKSLEYFSDLGGGGFDGFECSAEDTAKITRSDNFAKGGHSGAIGEPHWPEIAKFIVFGDKPFKGNEKTGEGEPFRERPVGWMKFLSDFRIGVPLAFSFAALIVLLLFSLWLPSENWRWSAIHPFGEWGWQLWIGGLAAFLILNFVVTPSPDGRNPAPRGWRAKTITILFVFCAAGVANFILTSLAREAAQFGWLDDQKHWVVFDAAGAALTLAVMVAAVRFILTRF